MKNSKNSLWKIAIAATLLLGVVFFVLVFTSTNPGTYQLENRVAADLRTIMGVLDKYRDDQGAYPSTTVDIHVLYSDGYVQNPTFNTDPWGSKLIYKLKNGTVTLYSIGANKLDEQGGGDDIVYAF